MLFLGCGTEQTPLPSTYKTQALGSLSIKFNQGYTKKTEVNIINIMYCGIQDKDHKMSKKGYITI